MIFITLLLPFENMFYVLLKNIFFKDVGNCRPKIGGAPNTSKIMMTFTAIKNKHFCNKTAQKINNAKIGSVAQNSVVSKILQK